MPKSRASYDRRQREQQKKAKAAAKRERRLTQSTDENPTADGEAAPAPASDDSTVLAQLERLHEEFEKGTVDFDSFEDRRAELLSRLHI